MRVILTERVKSLGNIGELVNVSQGHARNYLIPNKLAKLADEGNEKQMADYQKMLAKKVAEERAEAEAAAKKLSGLTVTIVKKIGGNGRLFGTVTNSELAKELEKQDVVIERRLITIETPIKTLGEFDITAKFVKGVEATFKVKVELDPKQAEEIKKKQEAAAARAAKKKEAKAESGEDEATAEVTEVTDEATETETEA